MATFFFSDVHVTLLLANEMGTISPKRGCADAIIQYGKGDVRRRKLQQQISSGRSGDSSSLHCTCFATLPSEVLQRELGWGQTACQSSGVTFDLYRALIPTLKSLAMRLLFINGEVAVLGGRCFLMEAVAVRCEDGQQPLLFLLCLRQLSGRSGQDNKAL